MIVVYLDAEQKRPADVPGIEVVRVDFTRSERPERARQLAALLFGEQSTKDQDELPPIA